MPPWTGPPCGVLPGAAALEVIVAANERAGVYLGRCAAYPTGFEIDIRVLLAPEAEDLDPSLGGIHRRPGHASTYDSMVRFGIEFADGRKVTNVGDRGHWADEPEGPVLWGMGGGGGGGRWHQDFWVWPLPPAGPVWFVCEWPAAGIQLSRVEVDGQLILDAASRSRELFPNRPTSHSGATWTSVGTASAQVRRSKPPEQPT